MLCTNCNAKEATFHYKQIIGGKKSEHHLCSDCAANLGYTGGTEHIFDIGSILNDFISIPSVHTAVKSGHACPECATSYEEFKRTGLLGCANCYKEFASVVEASLARIQPSTTHKGALSGETGEKINKENELITLKNDLKKAIIDERYEDAAVLRDKIKKMEERENG